MKKKYSLPLFLILNLCIEKKSEALFVSGVESFDPVVDLRTPRSLFELLHVGINDVCSSLQFELDNRGNLLTVLQTVENTLNDLSNTYDSMINTTRTHHVHHDDKEFLQKMIDRITDMIDQLENNDSDQEPKEEVQAALRSVKSSCDSFKAKI